MNTPASASVWLPASLRVIAGESGATAPLGLALAAGLPAGGTLLDSAEGLALGGAPQAASASAVAADRTAFPIMARIVVPSGLGCQRADQGRRMGGVTPRPASVGMTTPVSTLASREA